MIYYGNKEVRIDDKNIAGLEIRYRGSIEYTDTTPEGFGVMASKNMIVVFPFGSKAELVELFTYRGDFKILSCKGATWAGEYKRIAVKNEADYSVSRLAGDVEDMTLPVDKMRTPSTGKVKKTKALKPALENLHTATHKATLYLKDGTEYTGDFHIHLETNQAMSGAVHDDNSVNLYIKQIYENKVTKRIGRGIKPTRRSGGGSAGGGY